MIFENELKELKKQCLVLDIETSSHYPDSGKEIPISNIDAYIEYAVVKWVGMYSFSTNKTYLLNAITDAKKICNLIDKHKVLVTFNGEEFDCPILASNGFIKPKAYKTIVDCMVILGKSVFKTKSGFAYKDRGNLMDYKFKNNKLKTMAEAMDLETQKGDIKYEIFHKTQWPEEEITEIKKYLEGDVLVTKQMFEKLWDYWKPFTDLLDISSVLNLSWIRNSIASMTYKSACHFIGVEPTYGEKKSKKEKMGGHVYTPKYEEAKDVWYLDFASLYPHVQCSFNLFSEVTADSDKDMIWSGNDLFKVRGIYNISKKHPLAEHVIRLLKQRAELKKTDKDNPMVFAIKIFMNALYGVIRSAIFEKVHTPNAGHDTCWLGQQIQKLTEDMMEEFGFETIGGDTDSILVRAYNSKNSNREYVKECLKKVITKIKANVPFSIDTFNIDIEEHIKYIKFPLSYGPIVDEKVRKLFKDSIPEGYDTSTMLVGKKEKEIIVDMDIGKVVKIGRSWVKEWYSKKKNYLFIVEEEGKDIVKLVGLPIKKENACPLSLKIYKEVLEEQIIKQQHANFDRKYIEGIVDEWLKSPDIMKLLAIEYKVKPANTYKKESQIQAQVSRGYCNGQDGIVFLIKNNVVGDAGKGQKYCTVSQAIENKLTIKNIDLTKLWNELCPFIKNERIVE